MRMRGKKVIAAWLVLLLFSLAACGRQNEEATAPSDVGEQSSVTEQITESSTNDLTGENTDNSGGEEGSQSVREMTVAEKIKTFTVEGCSLPLPCQVKDLAEGLSLGEGITLVGITGCDLMHEDEEVCTVYLPEISLTSASYVDMSTGYEDAWITSLNMSADMGDFEIAGVTPASTMEEIIDLWGEPDVKKKDYLEYKDYNEKTGELTAHIDFSFLDGKIMIIGIRQDKGVTE